MKWWNRSSRIPTDSTAFQNIINGFLFQCPACIRKPTKVGDHVESEIKKTETQYIPVSARGKSFKERNITGSLLIIILTQIRRDLLKNNTYASLKITESVEDTVSKIIKNTQLKDDMFELMVFHKRKDMPDTEAIYYYIRNAFAHGSFEVLQRKDGNVYILESRKNDSIKARMRIKEKNMVRYVELAQMSLNKVKALRK